MDKPNEIDQAVRRYYAQSDIVSLELIEAIFYSVEVGGKRICPLIFLEILEGFGIELAEGHFDVTAASEMTHTGSSIHDDLPVVDDDGYRRGRLTNHEKFGKTTTILAGSSLFLDPFGLMANTVPSADTRVRLIAELSQVSGTCDTIGGQVLDVRDEECKLNLSELQMIYTNKAGKLLILSVVAAGIVTNLAANDLKSLREVDNLVELALQICDDILDVIATFEEIGEAPKKDLFADGATYPNLLSLEKSYSILNRSINQALAVFQKLPETQAFNIGKITEMIKRLRLHTQRKS